VSHCLKLKLRSAGICLRAKEGHSARKKIDIVCIDKCWYEIWEQKEVLVSYTGIYWPILSTVLRE
jgi:hypothetical protein